MKRILSLIFAVLAFAAAALLLRFPREPSAARLQPAPPQLPDVRIEHEFVRIPVPAFTTGSDRGRRPLVRAPMEHETKVTLHTPEQSAPAVSPVSSQPTSAIVQPPAQNPTLFDKARRALIGDGRHRPEPFPRVRDK